MKAVVVEIKGKYAALLQDDGCVIRIKNRNFMIGEVVQMQESPIKTKSKFSAMAAAAALFLALVGGGAYAYSAPYYYVSLDVNPSVMMEVNRFDRVVSVEAVNEDAAAVLEGLDLENEKVEDAITETVGSIEDAGYFAEGGNIMIATASEDEDKAEEIAAELKEAAEEEIADENEDVEVASEALGYQMVQEAKALGITPGKYNIITHLLGEEATEENINASVKELMTRYTADKGNKYGKAKKAEDTAADTPAAVDKAPNANARQNNVTGEKPETPAKSQGRQ